MTFARVVRYDRSSIVKGRIGLGKVRKIELFGDSVGRGVYFDEEAGRYMLGRETYVKELRRRGYVIGDHTMIGATVQKGEAMLAQAELDDETLAVVEYGGNDSDLDWKAISADPDREHQPKVSREEFRAGIRRMVEEIRRRGARALVVIPLPVVAERYFQWISRTLNKNAILKYLGSVNYLYRRQEQYAMDAQRAAIEAGAEVFDLRSAFLEERNYEEYMCGDGIHPNQKGQELIRREVVKLIRDRLR